ncbi:hypothetical protein NECAME_02350 [Necator americanus]|uniref:Uncharacterized protein n=1 Tax=Necator americanus TaxID=51031 RepID=W2THV1_NECAM|nr:hypothetical protein NECAME_02350 [Necator americanus]ETN80602.1 hypothetical protein NECAME_02350 [Necator americanus]
MSLSYLLLPLLSSFTSSIGFASLLLNWKSTIIYQLTELLIALLLSIDYIPIAVFILQLAIVVKISSFDYVTRIRGNVECLPINGFFFHEGGCSTTNL